MKRKVVVIGAGVSASCGVPVAKDILGAAIVHFGTNSHESREIHKALEYLYPNFDPRFKSYPNVEDFLNLLEMARIFNSEEFIESSLWTKKRLTRVTDIVLRGISDLIWSFSCNSSGPSDELRRYISEHLAAGDVIVTFNWDLMVEQALYYLKKKIKVGYQYSRKSADNGLTLLKPHGSVNWFEDDACVTVENLPGISLDPKIKLIQFSDLLLSRDQIDPTPIIVPPITNKDFLAYPLLSQTWASVYRAVSDATVLIILGYSLPKEDQFSRFVLRRALRQNILRITRKEKKPLKVRVVNPDENTEGTFARLVDREHVEFVFHRAYFKDYVSGITPGAI